MTNNPRQIGIDPARFAEQLSDEDRQLFERVDLAIDIEVFLKNHPVGQFLSRLVEIERGSAVEDLIKVLGQDPYNTNTVMQVHRRIAMCDQFTQWLHDALETGREAEKMLKDRAATD